MKISYSFIYQRQRFYNLNLNFVTFYIFLNFKTRLKEELMTFWFNSNYNLHKLIKRNARLQLSQM